MLGLIHIATILLALLVGLFTYRTYHLSRNVWQLETKSKTCEVVRPELPAVHQGQMALRSYVEDLF